jgi:hypothetical protein
MEVAPGGSPLVFEVTFDANDLNVAMSVYDTTGVSPVLVQGPTAMVLVADYTYSGKFTGSTGHTYVIIKAVYTDGSFVTLSPNYSQGSESIIGVDFGGGGSTQSSTCEILGFVDNNNPVIGLVNC